VRTASSFGEGRGQLAELEFRYCAEEALSGLGFGGIAEEDFRYLVF